MDIGQFLIKNGAAVIAVGGTIAGILITQLFNLLLKKREWKNQARLRKLERSIEFEKYNLIEPIIEFIEAELSLIQLLYAKGFDKEDKAINSSYRTHLKHLLRISAKVKVYGDKDLIEKFEHFTRKRLMIGNNTLDEKEKNLNNAYSDLKEAENLAAEILKTLKARLSDVET